MVTNVQYRNALDRLGLNGFLASVTERHAVGRNMAPMGRRRSCCGCCWQAGSGPRTFITPGGIARVDRRVGQGLRGGQGGQGGSAFGATNEGGWHRTHRADGGVEGGGN